jgi:hypothetical protein
METTMHQTDQPFSIENPFVRNTSAKAKFAVQETAQSHKGHPITYFLWTYAVIFTSIMLIVMVEERFFIK